MERYYATSVNGKGYIYDRCFSMKVPIAVEKKFSLAKAQVRKFNNEEKSVKYFLVTNDCGSSSKAHGIDTLRDFIENSTNDKEVADEVEKWSETSSVGDIYEIRNLVIEAVDSNKYFEEY